MDFPIHIDTNSTGMAIVYLCAWLETEGLRVRASPVSLRCGPWARHIYPSLVLFDWKIVDGT